MDQITSLPNELKLNILQKLSNAADVLRVKQTNRTFYHFVQNFAKELARFKIHAIELRAANIDTPEAVTCVNVIRQRDGVAYLWQSSQILGTDLEELRDWSSKIMFADDLIQIRLCHVSLTSSNIAHLLALLRGLLSQKKQEKIEFKLMLISCDFFKVTASSLVEFFDFFTSNKLNYLLVENIPDHAADMLCNSLIEANVHLVHTLRLQFSNSTTDHNSSLFSLLQCLQTPARRLERLIIDGNPVPLPTIAEFITDFCANPYVDVLPTPPYVRCFFSIDNRSRISDVKDLREMAHQQIMNRKRKSAPMPKTPLVKRRRMQIYVEFGYYEEDLPLNQTLHCVIGLSVKEWEQRNGRNGRSNAIP